MIRRVRRTSITSISGVVFISTITSPSPLALPTFIDMVRYLLKRSVAAGVEHMRFGDEADLLDASLLARQNDAAHRFEPHILVTSDMHFWEALVPGDGILERRNETFPQLRL